MTREERHRPAVAYLFGPGAVNAAPGERQVAFDLRTALGVRNDHGVRQDPAAASPRPGHPRGSEAGARRRPGLGVAREAREAGVSLGMRRTGATTLDTPFSPAWGTVAGLRGLGLAAAQGFSRPGVPQKSAVASAAREAGAAQHPHRGTASARPALVSPLRSLGEGGDTKASRRSQSDACISGRRGRHLPLEQTAPPIINEKPMGTLGAVVGLAQMLRTFARRGLVRSLAIPEESDSPGSH